jgi:hypothetical protein
MTIEIAINALTIQTTGLLEACTILKDSAAQLIIDAVIVSENAAIAPLLSMATNLVDTQALLVTYITKR